MNMDLASNSPNGLGKWVATLGLLVILSVTLAPKMEVLATDPSTNNNNQQTTSSSSTTTTAAALVPAALGSSTSSPIGSGTTEKSINNKDNNKPITIASHHNSMRSHHAHLPSQSKSAASAAANRQSPASFASSLIGALGSMVPGLITNVAPLVVLFGLGALMMPALGLSAASLTQSRRR